MSKVSKIICILIPIALIVTFCVARFNGQGKKTVCTVIDDYGREVAFKKNPRRIISLAPACTEILFALGLGNKILGVDNYSDYPEEAKSKTKVGSYLSPNLEVIASLEPDLILVSDIISKEYVANLEEKNFVVLALAPKSIKGIIRDIRIVGKIGNKITEANDLIKNMEKRINTITKKTSSDSLYHPRIYMEYYPYWTYGPRSFGNDLISMVGGTNIARITATAYSEITDEFIVWSNPEIIIFTTGSYFYTTVKDIKRRTGWNKVDAVRNDKIYTIDDDIISRPGPRIVDGLEHLARLIHPELFSLK